MNVCYSWICVNVSTLIFGSAYNWKYWSYETGTVEKLNQNDTWKFQGPLTHSSIQRVGTTPPTHNFTVELGYAVSNVLTGRRQAQMDVEFVVYEQVNSGTGFNQVKSYRRNGTTKCLAP